MRLDYSDKMTAVKEGAGRPVPKNRPRREPIGGFLLVALVLMVIGYVGGVLTGWFLFKVKGGQPAPAPVAQQAKPAPQQSQPGAPGTPGAPAQPAPDVPLTFYKTLPSGGKGAMGSGINTKLPAIQPKSAPAADGAPQAKPAPAAEKEGEPKNAARSVEEKPAEKRAAEKPAAEKQAGEQRFLVQVASYKNKQEAEAVHARLAAKGVAAYLVESKLQDKGVWYRIRVGRHLTREEAQQLAAKVGAGATVIAE